MGRCLTGLLSSYSGWTESSKRKPLMMTGAGFYRADALLIAKSTVSTVKQYINTAGEEFIYSEALMQENILA